MAIVRVLIKDKQNIIKVDNILKGLICYCCKLVLFLEKFKYFAEVSVLLTENEFIKSLNYKYKNRNFETDVLSFPEQNFDEKYTDFSRVVILGDIVISTQKALEQFKIYCSCCVEEEIARLTIHSMLHLLGYDHEKEKVAAKIMFKKEKILSNIVKRKFKFERVKDYEK